MYVIVVTYAFRYFRKISNSFLSLEKILYHNLVISSYQKITYMFQIDQTLVCISLITIIFYRRDILLEEMECQFLIHIPSSLTILIIYSFQTMDQILFLYSILFLNSYTRFLYQIILQELLQIHKEGLLQCLRVITTVFRYFDISSSDFVHYLF